MADSTFSRRRFLLAGAAMVTAGGLQALPLPRARRGTDLWAGDFGAVGDGVADDGPALRRALGAAQAAGPGATLRLGPGRHRVGGAPGSRFALPLSGASELTIAGGGATVVVADPALGCLSLSDCDGCAVQGVTIDYDPVPFAETVVTAVHRPGRAFDVEVTPGHPLLDAPFFTFAAPEGPPPTGFGAVFDPATRRLKDGVVDHVLVTAAERLGPRSFRLGTRDDVPPGLTAGDVFVYLARQHGHALACYRSSGTSVRDVHVRAANAVAFGLVQSDAVRIAGCSVGFEQGSARLVSANGDGVHAQACRIGPTVEDCRFEGMMDDGLNIYVPALEILAVPAAAEIVVAGNAPVRPGDRLEFSEPASGRIKGVRQVEDVRSVGTGGDRHLRLDSPLPGLSPPCSCGVADIAFNLSASGEGYVIRNNVYERHRGHAMRLHTGRGVVEGNGIRGTSRDGILVLNDPDWPEGPHTRDLLLRGNTLEATGGDAAIDVEGRKLGYELADTPTQRDIRIEGNTIVNWRGSAIDVGAAHDVTIRDTVLTVDDGAVASAAERGVRLERVHGVEIDGLVVRTAAPGALAAAVEIGPTVTGGGAGVRIGGVQVPDGMDAVLDRRTGETAVGRRRRSRLAEAVELASRAGPVA